MAPENSSETWMACEPGTLQRLSTRSRRRAPRQLLIKRSAAAVSGVVGSLALGMLLLNPIDQFQPSGVPQPGGGVTPAVASHLHCREVLDRREAYLLGNLDDTERKLVSTHLGSCLHCQQIYRQRAHELNIEFLSGNIPPAGDTARSLLAAR